MLWVSFNILYYEILVHVVLWLLPGDKSPQTTREGSQVSQKENSFGELFGVSNFDQAQHRGRDQQLFVKQLIHGQLICPPVLVGEYKTSMWGSCRGRCSVSQLACSQSMHSNHQPMGDKMTPRNMWLTNLSVVYSNDKNK